MNTHRDPETLIAAWLDDGPAMLPVETRQAIAAGVRTMPRRRPRFIWVFGDARLGRQTVDLRQLSLALGGTAAVVLMAAVGVNLWANLPSVGSPSSPSAAPIATAPSIARPSSPAASPTVTASPSSVDLGIFEPFAGRIVYANSEGIWGVDPAAPADLAAIIQLTSEAAVPLGWSSDGTKLLFMRQGPSGGQLFVLRADGSETQVTEPSMASGSAAISPDGSRVVFQGGTGIAEGRGGCCARYGLYVVDMDGGPAELILDARDALVWELTFSPDGTQIAYVEGAGDHSNSVSLMAVDGSGAHQIVSNEGDRVAAGHVYGLQWSPAGDRIALGLGGAIYTFATDGSDFTKVITVGNSPYWSPDGTQIAFHRMAGGAAIADADGSNVRDLGFATNPGPWHPGTSVKPATVPSPSVKSTVAPVVSQFEGLLLRSS